MRKSAKEYLAAFGKVGFIMAAFLVGDIIGIVQSYSSNFILPQWIWWLILVVILAVSPLIAFHKLRLKRDELQNQLDEIKNARPNIVLLGTENVITPIRNGRTRKILGTPCFTHILIKNDPSASLQAVDATNVAGHIDIYDQNRQHLFYMIGRWSETREEAMGAQPTEMEQISIPPNGRANPMDIALKYQEEEEAYGHNNASRRTDPVFWRDKQKLLPRGNYFARVRLQGNNVDKTVLV